MFDELEKYSRNGNFFLQATDRLEEVCNAPRDHFGVFLVYALRKGKVELVYVGKSGFHVTGAKAVLDTSMHDGLRENLIEGLHFDETKRKNCWPVQMLIEDIEALHIHWYVTCDGKHKDRPKAVKMKILKIYKNIYGDYPRWNSVTDRC
jgi:hypothetical protein